MDRQFTPTAFLIVSGLGVWLADFMLVYVGAALICARAGGALQVFGVPAIKALAVAVSVLAAAATVVLARRALQRAQAAANKHERFTFFQAVALSGLALIAIAWTAAPALLLPPGCS